MLESIWAKPGLVMNIDVTHMDSVNYTTIPSAAVPRDHLCAPIPQTQFVAYQQTADSITARKEEPPGVYLSCLRIPSPSALMVR